MLPPGGAMTAGRLPVSRHRSSLTAITPHMTQAAKIPTLVGPRIRWDIPGRLMVTELTSSWADVRYLGPLPLL